MHFDDTHKISLLFWIICDNLIILYIILYVKKVTKNLFKFIFFKVATYHIKLPD